MKRLLRASMILALLPLACTGAVGGDQAPSGGAGSRGGSRPNGGPGPSGGPGSGGGPGSNGGPGVSATAKNAPGVLPLRRLSIREYNNTLRDLLGVNTSPGKDFASDDDAGGFSTGGPITTSSDAARFLDAADRVAATVKIETVLPCGSALPTAAPAQETCMHQFIEQFGRRAFRRPLAPDEANELFAVYTAHRGPEIGYGFAEAARAVVSAVLTSPYFLYRAELGLSAPLVESGLVRFNAYEVASRLSYGLWGSMPDDQLFTLAASGRLTSFEEIEKQSRRMLADPKARDAIVDFHLQWVDVARLAKAPPKDPRFATYTPDLVLSMLNETASFVADVMGPKGDGSLEKLLTSTSTTIDPALGAVYGVSTTGTGPQQVALPSQQRAGILTQASFLSMHATATDSHPVRRGATVLRRLFCEEIEPPANVEVGQPKPPADGVTTRERFAEHAKQACATCHRQIDPIGFAFENYDAVGAYRTMDKNKPVDASGTITVGQSDVKFNNAVDLMKLLANNEEVRRCVATQWLRYMVRRGDVAGDQASIESASAAFKASKYDLRELVVALTKTPAFTHRQPAKGESLQ